MEPQSFGSFGNIAPDAMSAIREALERRGMGDSSPALNQQSAASPTMAPQPAQPGGQMRMPSPQVAQEAPKSIPTENSEAKLIVNALINRLKTLSNMEFSNGVQ